MRLLSTKYLRRLGVEDPLPEEQEADAYGESRAGGVGRGGQEVQLRVGVLEADEGEEGCVARPPPALAA